MPWCAEYAGPDGEPFLKAKACHCGNITAYFRIVVTRILHISDLHFPSRDAGVAQVLAEAIVSKKPNVLVVTGDLANNPSLWWPFKKGRWIDVRTWLEQILGRIPGLTIFVLPGNHDAMIRGIFGPCCWPAVKSFRVVFGEWCQPGIHFDTKANIAYLTLDTNPRLAVFQGAEGKVLKSRLKRLKKALHSHAKAAQIQRATKILLMHHHPLPAPFGGPDFLLHTRRGDLLLNFLAEHQIGLVVHGHKHRATWSHVRLGGSNTQAFFMEIVGAGAAMKASDYDPRGHNFNLIDIAANGVRTIRQFFKPAGGRAFEEALPSPAESDMGRLIQSHFRLPYRMKRITWHLHIDEEGDGANEVVFEGLVFNWASDSYEVLLPKDEVENGEALEYTEEAFLPAKFGGHLQVKDTSGGRRTYITFTEQPTDDSPATATVKNYYLNTYVMDRREAEERGFKDIAHDSIEYQLVDSTDELAFRVEFPSAFVPANIRLEVLEPLEDPDVINQTLTGQFADGWNLESNVLCATLAYPLPNFRYRLGWDIPPASLVPEKLKRAYARRSRFEQDYLEFRLSATPEDKGAKDKQEGIIQAFECLFSELDKNIMAASSATDSLLDLDDTDLAFFVCDRHEKPHRMRMVEWNHRLNYPDYFANFWLAIGEGNAGRAYKTKTVRLYDEEAARDDPKSHTYKRDPGGPAHKFLISFPLLDPWSGIPIGVISAGTADPKQADLMRALTRVELDKITTTMQNAPLVGLLLACGLKTGV